MQRDLLQRMQELRAQEPADEDTDNIERVVIEIENNNSQHKISDEFKEKVIKIQSSIDQINEHTSRARQIHSVILSTVDKKSNDNDELEDIMSKVKRLAVAIRASLKEIQSEADKAIKENPTSAIARMRVTQQQALNKMFVDSMTAYNEAQMEFRDKCKKQIIRQLAVTGKETSEDALEDMLAGNFDVFTQGIIADTAKERQALADVNARHQDIMKLEKSIIELRDMFMEMAILIENQGGLIDRIENNVVNAAEYVEQAKNETKVAQEYQQKAAKKKIWLIAILVLVILIILICILI